MSPLDRLESFDDLAPEPDDFLADVLVGLSRPQKKLPCKYIYDEKGSQLFDQICELPEYYLTRTEMALIEEKGAEIAACVGPSAQIVEYGCGSVQKIRLLLDALEKPVSYVAVDISREHLLNASAELAMDFPELEVHGLCADFTKRFDVPPASKAPGARRVGFFPGSTLGNFDHKDAVEFLASAAQSLGIGGGMIIGIDLKKDDALLNAAYNDSQGITAQFNLNLLERINRELKGDFDIRSFTFKAQYEHVKGRVESHLYSSCAQTVHVDGETFKFDKGESIHTENSHKYSVPEFRELARSAGFDHKHVWTDAEQLFSIHYLEVAAQ